MTTRAAADEFKSWPLQLQRDCLLHCLGLIAEIVAFEWEQGRRLHPDLVSQTKRQVLEVYRRKASAARKTADDTYTCECSREIFHRKEGTRLVKVDWPEGTLHACTPGVAP